MYGTEKKLGLIISGVILLLTAPILGAVFFFTVIIIDYHPGTFRLDYVLYGMLLLVLVLAGFGTSLIFKGIKN